MNPMRNIAVLLLLLCAIAGVQAATIVVSPSGGDYVTVQEGIAAAAPGDIVELLAGRYPGEVTVDKAVAICSDEGAIIGSDTDRMGLLIEADGVAVSGVAIEGPATGIFLRKAGNFSVRQCSFADTDVGIVAETCANGILEDNTFASVGAAFLGMGTADVMIRNSSFDRVTQYLQFYAASGCRVETESLHGPEYFAADIFSNTEYECGPWTATGWDFALLETTYEASPGYTLMGETANISFIEDAESTRMSGAVLRAHIVAEEGQEYGFYRVDSGNPVLISDSSAENGTVLVEAAIANPGHYALMEKPVTGGGELVIAAITVLVVAVLLAVLLLRRRK